MKKKIWNHAALAAMLTFAIASASTTASAQTGNVITQWSAIVQPAIIGSPARPATSSEVLHTMVHLAVYDAVMAINGGYRPYAASIQAPAGADVPAAVATAAYRVARARVDASQFSYLDTQYATFMAQIPDGLAKTDGIQVGERSASAMLALRAQDGFNNAFLYECSSVPAAPGEFEPNGGCGTQPVDVKLFQVTPFTFADPSRYMPSGPNPLTSTGYTEDFIETRDMGRANSTFRTAEQTDVAYFWAENPYIHWNRNLVRLAVSSNLDVPQTARFFAMVHTAVSDAVIAGFNAKYAYRHWRPRTAIPRADVDGNPDTVADPSWTPLLTVNHPEYPSGHGFWSTALTDAVASFFGTNRVVWTIETSKTAVPQLVLTERTYSTLNAITREVEDARIWSGLHWRHSMRDGAQIGRRIAREVTRLYFRPVVE